jgi:two-component system chemotaxis response regulator CheB
VSSDRIVVIAASAGSLDAICDLLDAAGPDFRLPIVVVQHRGDSNPELLPQLLARRTDLDVRHAENGDLLAPGVVYVCPPGAHLTAEYSLRVAEGPRIGFVRPSADLMFRSVARAYGPRAIAVVLSGRGRDGARGSIAVAEGGGMVLVQAPESSAFPAMPEAAIRVGRVDHVLSPEQIGRTLRTLAGPPAEKKTVIRVLLADDHRIIVDGLRTLLEREKDMQIIGEAADGRAAVQLARRLPADVIVMDVAMPELNGVDAVRRIRVIAPKIRVLALSANTDRRTVAEIVRAGATGYLSKSSAFGELARAIRAVAAGNRYFSPPIVDPGPDASADGDDAALSANEREVLRRMAEGLESSEIAVEMGLPVAEVKAHGARLMEKLGRVLTATRLRDTPRGAARSR